MDHAVAGAARTGTSQNRAEAERQPTPSTVADQPPPPADRSSLLATVTGVDKRFGGVVALNGLNIDIADSRITVLLGPNGAGKTTAIRMITGALKPDRGTATVFGTDPAGPDGEAVRRRCGVVSAKPSLYDRLNGTDNLRYAAELYGLGRNADRRIVEAAAQFGIDDALDQQVGGYSTGMKTRLALARAVLHRPDLLILDEPTSGLDPESAQSVLRLVRDMTAQGHTVLMCTHLLSEAEGLADEVVIMEHGTTMVAGDPRQLARRYWPQLQVTITADRGQELDRIQDHPAMVAYHRAGNDATVTLADERAIGEIITRLTLDGVQLRAVVPYNPSLEDLYFAVRREQQEEST